MATTDKESSAAGTDNRPPMLEESDFESWKIRIERTFVVKVNHKTQTRQKETINCDYVDLYTHLKSYEQHAMKTLSKMNQTSGNANPLAYMAQATHSTSSPSQYVPPPPQYAPAPQQAPQSDPKMPCLRTSSSPKTQATIQAGHITTENVQRRAPSNKGKHASTGSQGKVVTCYNSARVKDNPRGDAYDSDVDEAPHAAATFMANLMQTSPSTRQGTSIIRDTRGEQLDSDVGSVIDDHDNTIPYHQYQLNNEVKSVPTDVSSVIPGGISVITILDDLRYKTQVQNLEQTKVKKDLEQLVFERNKRNTDLEEQLVSLKQQLLQHVKSNKSLKTESEKLKADNKALRKYWKNSLVEEILTRVYDSEETLVQAKVSRTKMLKRMKDPLCKMSSKPINYAKLNSLYDTFVPQKQLSSEQVYWLPANEVVSYNYICSVVLTYNIVVPMSVESRSNCVKEHSRNLELEAEILKVKQLLVEKEKRCSFIEMKYQELELKFQKKLKAQIGNMKEVSAEPNLSTLEFQALETKNTQLKEELTAVRIKNDSLRDENVSIKKRYQDLYKSKAESNSNVSSGVAVPEKPKVLAHGLYAMTPKYVPPQKRNNKEANTPLLRKETVSLVKKSNVCVNLSTGIKYVTEASKSKSKCETKTHRNLPARSKNVKRVDNPLRSLNKRNRVDSSLSVKRTRFISNSISVCNICNECLVFGNHNKCGVKNLNFVNAKNLKVNNDATVKQVWKTTGKIFASVGSKWRPTGRKFTLGDTCLLTRITKPEVVPLEKSGSVSTSDPTNNVIVTPRFSKKPLTSYKRKDSKLKDTSTGSPPNAKTKAVNDPVVQIVLWYLDSGCSRHMTGDRSKLINYVEKFIGTVRFGNDQFAAIVGYGDYKIGDTIITRRDWNEPQAAPSRISAMSEKKISYLDSLILASRLQSVGLQTKLLHHTGIVASGPIFDDVLFEFNTSMETNFLSNSTMSEKKISYLDSLILASRLQSVGLQTKLLRHTGIVASGPIFDDVLFEFNTSMETDFLSNSSEIAALKLMKKMTDIYFTRITKNAESTFFLSPHCASKVVKYVEKFLRPFNTRQDHKLYVVG
ncbi:hypothetical protein Tco_0597935 [Tanacetum coccineum]